MENEKEINLSPEKIEKDANAQARDNAYNLVASADTIAKALDLTNSLLIVAAFVGIVMSFMLGDFRFIATAIAVLFIAFIAMLITKVTFQYLRVIANISVKLHQDK